MPLISGLKGTSISSLSSCLDRGFRNDMSLKINTVPIANYRKERRIDVSVCVCGTPTDRPDNKHDHYSNKVSQVNRAVCRKLLQKKMFCYTNDSLTMLLQISIHVFQHNLPLSPCEGQSYCIRLSRSLSKCNCSHIELRVIKTVCHCSFPFPRIDKSQGIDCTVIELLCNVRIICK